MIDYSLVDNWYKFGIPKKFISSQLLEFVLKSNTITSFVKEIPVKLDVSAKSAYTDGINCFLAGIYFQKDFYSDVLFIKPEKDQIKACIAVNNGIQIHEALHVDILGTMNKIDMIDENPNSSPYRDNAVFGDLLNIVEDLFSENLCFENNKKAYVFLETMNNIFFNEQAVDYRKSQLFGNKSLKNILNMLPIFRNRYYLGTNLAAICGLEEFTDILFKALNTNLTIYDRVQIAIELMLLIENNKDLKQQSDAINMDFLGSFETIDKLAISELDANLIEILKNNEKELDSLSKMVDVLEKNTNLSIPIEFLEVTNYTSSEDVELDTNFSNFAFMLNHFRQEKNNAGNSVILGNKFKPSQFYKHSIDGKIMSIDNSQIVKKGNPEIILLIDASGSMRGKLLDKTINVCYSVFVSLKNNNIPCAVYAHTTLNSKCLIVGVASYLMPLMNDKITNTNNVLQRFKNLHGVRNSQNADGIAINFVGDRFPKSKNDKFLLVLSDGQPAFTEYGYGSYEGGNHTTEIVKKLDKNNVYVASLSLTEDVVKNNNKIYGSKRNVKAYGDLLQENMKNLIYKITQRN